MLFRQFSNIIINVKIVGKIPDPLLSVWLFSNPGKKVQILVESTGQICLVVLHLFWTLSPGFGNNHKFKFWSGIIPKILTYMIMLENCHNNISVYGWPPIQGTKFYSWIKSGSKSGTYILKKDKNSSYYWLFGFLQLIWRSLFPPSELALRLIQSISRHASLFKCCVDALNFFLSQRFRNL